MFIIELEYLASLTQIDGLLMKHRAWLDEQYQQGVFLFSGPKAPRTGGIIIASSMPREELDQLLLQDPFAKNELVTYSIKEFHAIKGHPLLQQFVEK